MQLVEAPSDLREQRAAPDGDDHVIRGLPAQLLGGLEREGLGPLGVEGPDVHVGEGPRTLRGDLGTKPVDVVVAPVDRDHVATEDGRAGDLRRLEVCRDEDVALETCPSGRRGNRVREVAGRRARQRLQPEFERLGQGDGHDAVLERVRGIPRVVLEPDLPQAELGGETVGPHEWRPADRQRCITRRIDRQQRRIAPDRRRPGRDRLPGDLGAHGRVVVHHLERAEAPLTGVDRGNRERLGALSAPQRFDVSHGGSSSALRVPRHLSRGRRNTSIR